MKETNRILWSKYGPRLEMNVSRMRNGDGSSPLLTLRISDLNPEQHMTWGLTRFDAIRIGWWFIRRAFFPSPWRK